MRRWVYGLLHLAGILPVVPVQNFGILPINSTTGGGEMFCKSATAESLLLGARDLCSFNLSPSWRLVCPIYTSGQFIQWISYTTPDFLSAGVGSLGDTSCFLKSAMNLNEVAIPFGISQGANTTVLLVVYGKHFFLYNFLCTLY